MTDATQFVQAVRANLREIDDYIRAHPYPEALRRKEVSLEALRAFPGHQYHIITSDLRSVGLLLSRHGIPPGREFFWMVLQGEVEALKGLDRFASSLGITGKDLEAYEPLPEAQAYKAYMAWLSVFGSAAEVAGAFLANFPAWGANCGRMSKALMEGYEFRGEDLSFFELFSTPVADFEEKARVVIEDGLTRGVTTSAIKEASRMLQGYELMFWDILHQVSS